MNRGTGTIGESFVEQRPQPLRRLEFGRTGWKKRQVQAPQADQLGRAMPGRTIPHQHPLLAQSQPLDLSKVMQRQLHRWGYVLCPVRASLQAVPLAPVHPRHPVAAARGATSTAAAACWSAVSAAHRDNAAVLRGRSRPADIVALASLKDPRHAHADGRGHLSPSLVRTEQPQRLLAPGFDDAMTLPVARMQFSRGKMPC